MPSSRGERNEQGRVQGAGKRVSGTDGRTVREQKPAGVRLPLLPLQEAVRHAVRGGGRRCAEMSRIATLTVQDAAQYLRDRGLSISPDTLRQGIKQGVYPFGIVIEMERSPVFQIFKKQLDAWIAERTVEE
nr:MAG TPA: Pyocin activator protein PrtN [Caudoviricetes sp.]